MEVTRYIYQSPYSQSVQFGRAETSTNADTNQTDTSSNPVANVVSLESKTSQENTQNTNTNKLLDLYA
ncbi:MAG: hypothetical protein PHX44_07710 [Sulfurimonas sp.]|uniref:hypothetical protein n=1 Tax=Sulfurimonas sp. TaxID=2022749 RepID=UPI00261AFC4B|nr:hypothetical protein [Sulfurimonas sp.]MDD2652921.1 hypothetical protein [Sulfurimonas sp.]MDD3452367.1 hypothetical protein [Sulfurimonas sp.]